MGKLLCDCVLQRFIHVGLNPGLHLVRFRASSVCNFQCFLEVLANGLNKFHASKSFQQARRMPGCTSDENSSSGAASTTLMVNLLLGCTVANPLDTKVEDNI